MAQPYDPTTSNQIAPYDANTDSAGTGRYDAGLSSAASSYQAKPIPPALIKAMAYYAKMVANGRKLEMEYAAYQAEYLQVITREAELTRLREAGSGALSAWCADYTTNLSGTVATLEVSGEVNPLIGGGINIKPGYTDDAAYNANYGKLQRSTLMSEAGFAWNLTMLQPWMKWTPFWRYATVTGKTGSTLSVNLHPILSKAGAWLAKQTDFNEPWQSSMGNVAVEYMSCHAAAFDVGDEVIVEFRKTEGGGFWYFEPVVIGFKDHPKVCFTWPTNIVIYLYTRQLGWSPTDGGGFKAFVSLDRDGDGDCIGVSTTTMIQYINPFQIYINSGYIIGGSGAIFSITNNLSNIVLYEENSNSLKTPILTFPTSNAQKIINILFNGDGIVVRKELYDVFEYTAVIKNGLGDITESVTAYVGLGLTTQDCFSVSVPTVDVILASPSEVPGWVVGNGAPSVITMTATLDDGRVFSKTYGITNPGYSGVLIYA